ncbi:MAG: helix-turn-helix transcriptional regulator [Candidatus Hodarchaeota archaeon]
MSTNKPSRLNKYSEAILAIIQKSPDPIPFSTIWRKSGFSKSTVSKYLKQLEADRYVDLVREKNAKRSRYRTTARGIQKSTGGTGARDVRSMVKFFSALNVPESTIWQATVLVSHDIDAFLAIPQSPELYTALLYIYINLITVKRFTPRKEFCELYHVKRLSLDYHVDKILDAGIGFHHVICSGLDYFFHDVDELGVNLHQLADARILQFLLQRQYKADANGELVEGDEPEHFPLEQISWEIVEELHGRNIVDENMRDAFLYFTRKYLVEMSIERNVPPELLPELQEPEPASISLVVEELRGFCNRCGNWVLQGQFTCTRCQQSISDREILFDCLEAQVKTRNYRMAFLSDTMTCKHCGHAYPRAWNLSACPNCEK